MVNLIVLLVKFLVAGVKLDVMFSGWDGLLKQINGLLDMIKGSGDVEVTE